MRNRSLSIENVGNIKLDIGTFNNQAPKVFFVTGCSWIECAEANNYGKALEYIKTRMHKRIRERLSKIDCLDDRFILNFGLTANNMNINVTKFFKFSIFFKQKGENKDLQTLKQLVESCFLDVFQEMNADFEECGFKCIKK
jgi:hypothetical protein